MIFRICLAIALTSAFIKSWCTDSEEIKILVLVIASDNLPCYLEEQAIWSSYMNSCPQNIESYLIKADPNLKQSVIIEGNVVWSQTRECLNPGILKKTIISLEAFQDRIENEFDYILRTNLSSFFVLPRLINFAKKLPRTRSYSGQVFASEAIWHDLSWVGGHGILMSSDLALELIKHKNYLFSLTYDHYDDIIMAWFFKEFIGVVPQEFPCFWISTLEAFENAKDSIPNEVFFFRLKHLGIESKRTTEEVIVQKKMRDMFYPQVIGADKNDEI